MVPRYFNNKKKRNLSKKKIDNIKKNYLEILEQKTQNEKFF